MQMRSACSLVLSLLIIGSTAWAQPTETSDRPASFYPIWQMLSRTEKLQFIAGYVQGWRDAASVTDVAITYVREQPQNALEVLEKIRRLYESDTTPDTLVPRIDAFYRNPENQSAPLSRAISAARAR